MQTETDDPQSPPRQSIDEWVKRQIELAPPLRPEQEDAIAAIISRAAQRAQGRIDPAMPPA